MIEKQKKLIAKIKIGQKSLSMADEDYRAMLLRITGKNSCTQMNVPEMELVLHELVRLGFKAQTTGKRPMRRVAANPLMSKIEALLLDNGWHWNYAHGTARRMFGVESVAYLDNVRLRKVVAALQIAANRKRGKGGGNGHQARTASVA
ncbi:gp16 family protein [Neisseria leonii]|uniref:gp16 family protein n=1 Tax=Neisseria leonii TaxID=2995413 RepID=UPI00237B414B|nr:regulatory protein GemA [Neisseria sp. 3986]MDD9325633.1 regulatory protein GemA [Neisseria sp. 3986]